MALRILSSSSGLSVADESVLLIEVADFEVGIEVAAFGDLIIELTDFDLDMDVEV